MQQEDDLRGLAKVMDFMRAISIVFVVINIYWYCYYAVLEWNINIEVVNKILLNFDRTAGLFGNMVYTKLFAVVFLALSCLGTKGVKEEKITWPKIYVFLTIGFYPILYELVDFGFAASFNSNGRILYPYYIRRLYLPVNGRIMDEPFTHKQYV